MRNRILALLAGTLLLAAYAPEPAAAQQTQQRARTQVGTAQRGTPHYDVVVEVPELTVDSIHLLVDNLRAHLSVDANVANLVLVQAGADVGIQRVELDIAGVVAEAYLYVDLDNVAEIIDRALTTLDNNPEILQELVATVDTAVGVVGQVGQAALQPGGVVDQAAGAVGRTLENLTAPNGVLSETLNQAGQTVQTVVTTAGSLVENTLDTAGNVVSSRTLASLTSLPLVRETTNTAGQAVRTVRDSTGRLIEYTLDRAGKVTNVRLPNR